MLVSLHPPQISRMHTNEATLAGKEGRGGGTLKFVCNKANKAYIPSGAWVNVLLSVPFLQQDDSWVYNIILLNMSYNRLHNTGRQKLTADKCYIIHLHIVSMGRCSLVHVVTLKSGPYFCLRLYCV